MTAYNAEKTIKEAIESVRAQTYKNWELIILDDASSDGTASIVKEYATLDSRIHHEPAPYNLGIAKNRNRMFTVSQGPLIAVLDSDDLWIDSQKLEKQVARFITHSHMAIVGTWTDTIDETGKRVGALTPELSNQNIRARILRSNQFVHSSIMFRRLFLGGDPTPYPETFEIGEDYALALKLGAKGIMENLQDTTTLYRVHSGGITKQKKMRGATDHLAIIKKYHAGYPGYLGALVQGYLRIAMRTLGI